MTELPGIMAAAAEVEPFCRNQKWRFCFIDGIAVQRWGIPRFTQDVDMTLLTGLGSGEKFIDALLIQFAGRIRDARKFALEHRVVLLRSANGVHIDVALGTLAFEEASVNRATPWKIADGLALSTCSAEDLVIYKVFAARDRDWSDVESVLTRQHGKLDVTYIRRELQSLLELKEDPAALVKFENMIVKVEQYLQC